MRGDPQQGQGARHKWFHPPDRRARLLDVGAALRVRASFEPHLGPGGGPGEPKVVRPVLCATLD